jgi:hypothetical protein
MSGNINFNGWINDDGTENYKCRAWVNFNGTGTVAIRASGNVSSITDNGTGKYTVNFTVAMVDTNYAAVSTAGDSGAQVPRVSGPAAAGVPTVSAYTLVAALGSTSAAQDVSYVSVAIFR